MAAIANSTYSNFSLHRLGDPSPVEPVLPHTYFGQGLSSIISLVNLCYAPFDFSASLKDRSEAERVGDTEGSFENWLRIIEAPFNIVASIGYNLENLQKIFIYLGVNAAKWPGFAEVI